ncbi:hypothetical protein KBJ94_27990 [Pseudomonas sp. ITA]|uniref:hypothetical protein n=1 Tax=Pseudomonas sp. ITA TaxID=2825841 RepID=UPI002498724E|nr:hypothetical protein [Pseudomonas sp. ITA]MDI2145890.1 hypothetical protein [Pseudomonas sp. ITA]
MGLLDLPLAMPALGLPASSELDPFTLAVGLFFVMPLFTLIFACLLFEAPMAKNQLPSLIILVRLSPAATRLTQQSPVATIACGIIQVQSA